MPQRSKRKANAKAQGKARYIGKVCAAHPFAKGARYVASGECAPCAIAKVAAYRATDRGRRAVLANARQRKYGVSAAQFARIFAAQNSCCAICKVNKPGGRDNAWQLDHSHATGKPRGILCVRCNLALGHFKDKPELLEAAGKYLAQNLDENIL